ncbi:cytochrome c [Luteitalea sp. TBR-22]|uniref:NapC/NirT family cytochrome c n=1 Tax=Luteitalea sp. TBR-22 TaxID=2802971 RepID=UPI001AFB57D6|nr:NapC/NirT family cytochrome c [Luteitalea sp. TBR-22]BCS32000.1 cytochrome c [Luteitalea sp. TBR-22]
MTDGRPILPRAFTAHPLAALGAALTTLSAVLFLLFWIIESAGWLENPYLGLLTFVLLPALFVFGLVLIPAGLWLARRRERAGKGPFRWPSLDLTDARVRGWVFLIGIATILNTLLVTMAATEAVHYMDSPAFCGQVCHTQMNPHYVQWQRGPAHTKVACASCHIGTGAKGFVMAKTRGTAQLLHVITGKYPTPVPTPLEYRPPAEQTCGKCHEATRWIGERRRLFTDIGEDQANTPTQTLLTLLVGGTRPDGSATGFHWHANPGNEIEYIATDEHRGKIPWVRVKNAKGEVKEFVVEGFDPAKGGERRRMDCIDCHNKVAHPFAASAERAVDRAIVDGRLDARLPFLRREAVKLLKAEYATHEQARTAIASALEKFYAGGEGAAAGPVDRGAVTAASRVLAELHGAYVFPAMKVTFGTYISNGGHTDADGCFRCHDDEHKAKDGSVIKQDCETCHREEEIAPATE